MLPVGLAPFSSPAVFWTKDLPTKWSIRGGETSLFSPGDALSGNDIRSLFFLLFIPSLLLIRLISSLLVWKRPWNAKMKDDYQVQIAVVSVMWQSLHYRKIELSQYVSLASIEKLHLKDNCNIFRKTFFTPVFLKKTQAGKLIFKWQVILDFICYFVIRQVTTATGIYSLFHNGTAEPAPAVAAEEEEGKAASSDTHSFNFLTRSKSEMAL